MHEPPSPPPAGPPSNPPPPAARMGWVVAAAAPGPAPGVEFAPHGPRLVAYLVDASLLVALLVALVLPLALVPTRELPWPIGVAWVALLLVIEFGAFPWCWVHGGQTPGMRLFGLHVVRDRDGGPIGWRAGLLRMVGLFFVSPVVFYLGFAWVFVDDRRRAWHDLMAGTLMVRLPGNGPGPAR